MVKPRSTTAAKLECKLDCLLFFNGNMPLSKLKQALNSNELPEYLMGQNDYEFIDKWTESPTDISSIFLNGLNEYVIENNENRDHLREGLTKSLQQLLKTTDGTWWTISIVYSYLFGFKTNALLFNIDIDPLVPVINLSLKRFKEELKTTKDWVGCWRFQNGLWDDITIWQLKLMRR